MAHPPSERSGAPSDPREPSRSGGDPRPRSERDGVPRWVMVLAVVGAFLAVLLLVAALFAPGGHGPGRHVPVGAGAGSVPAAAAGWAPGGVLR